MHGRSLLPLLRTSGDVAWRDAFLAAHFLEKVVPAAPAWKAVRTKQWKYIHYPHLDGMDELYHLQSDPGEVHNLIDNPDAQSARTELKARLEHLLETTR